MIGNSDGFATYAAKLDCVIVADDSTAQASW